MYAKLMESRVNLCGVKPEEFVFSAFMQWKQSATGKDAVLSIFRIKKKTIYTSAIRTQIIIGQSPPNLSEQGNNPNIDKRTQQHDQSIAPTDPIASHVSIAYASHYGVPTSLVVTRFPAVSTFPGALISESSATNGTTDLDVETRV